jgi:hypothetical protein
MTDATLRNAYDDLKSEATTLAGGLTDLAQRATVYHHLYKASGGNHVFPLIAAHGALWAGGYFRFALKLGKSLSWQFALNPALRRRRLEQLDQFANAFRNVNRQVCVDTYTNFHLSARFGEHPEIGNYIPANLLAAYRLLHEALKEDRSLTDVERKTVFEAHFLHEQQTIVGETVQNAVADFDWAVARFLALRPPVRFAYFPNGKRLWFRNFADQSERITNGFAAFDVGASVGWQRVEQALADYQTLPTAFFAGPVEYFSSLRQQLLTMS